MEKKRLFVLLGSICLILVIVVLPFMAACGEEAPAPAPAAAPAVAAPAGPDLSTPKGRIDYLFQKIPEAFVADAAGSWNTALHFAIGGAGDYHIGVADGAATSGPGAPDAPTCVIEIDSA